MEKQTQISFAGSFMPSKITTFGFDPTLCRTLVCSAEETECKFLDYCTGTELEYFSFNDLGGLQS